MSNQNAINAPTPITVSNGGSGLSSQTAYRILTGGTSNTGNLQNLASIGNLGQSVKSNGANALASFTGAGWVLIQSQTANNSASLDFTTGFSSNYANYIMVFQQIIPATDATILRGQISSDGGATWITSGYQSGINSSLYNSATQTNTNSTAAFVFSNALSNTGGNTAGMSGIIQISNLGQTAWQATQGCIVTSAAGRGLQCGGYNANYSFNANAIKFFMSSGNITSGTILIYGLSK